MKKKKSRQVKSGGIFYVYNVAEVANMKNTRRQGGI